MPWRESPDNGRAVRASSEFYDMALRDRPQKVICEKRAALPDSRDQIIERSFDYRGFAACAMLGTIRRTLQVSAKVRFQQASGVIGDAYNAPHPSRRERHHALRGLSAVSRRRRGRRYFRDEGRQRAAAVVAAWTPADARDLAQMRADTRAAFHRDRDRLARLRRVGETGERCRAHTLFETRDGRRPGGGDAPFRLRAFSRLRARSRRARRASDGAGFSRRGRSADAARHRADARDVRSDRPRIRHGLFPLVLPDPAVAAAGVADRRGTRTPTSSA